MPPNLAQLRILGSRIDAVDESSAISVIHSLLVSGQPHHVITGNTLMLLESEHRPLLRRAMERAALVVPESSGIRWASRRLGSPLLSFTPGIDLLLKLTALAAREKQSVYLLGSAPGVAEVAADKLMEEYPGLEIVGIRDGYFSEDDPSVLAQIREKRPRLVFVGLGMPRQEEWISEHLTEFGPAVVMGVGGSFDVISGKLKRAPLWMQRGGVEWLYRFYQEPWRWKRMAQLPLFAWKVIRHGN